MTHCTIFLNFNKRLVISVNLHQVYHSNTYCIDLSLSKYLKYISAIEIKHRMAINAHASKGLDITYIIQPPLNG